MLTGAYWKLLNGAHLRSIQEESISKETWFFAEKTGRGLLKRDCNHFNIVISLAFLMLKFWFESKKAGFVSVGELEVNGGVLKVSKRGSFKIDSRRIEEQRNAVLCRKSAPNGAAPDTFEGANAVQASSKTTWAEAWAICRKAGGRLLEQRTEPNQLRHVLEFSRGPKENYWVQSDLKPCSVTSSRHRSFVTESMGKASHAKYVSPNDLRGHS